MVLLGVVNLKPAEPLRVLLECLLVPGWSANSAPI